MNATNKPSSQRDIFGYGMELSDALERYSSFTALENNDKKRNILDNYVKWIKQCPHAEHLCFADITFFSADQLTVRDALTIVITPENESGDNKNNKHYINVLKNIYLDDQQYTMAPHKVFSHGLPFIKDSTDRVDHPETEEELEAFYKKNKMTNQIENGYFLGEIVYDQDKEEELTCNPQSNQSRKPFFCVEALDSTYDKSVFTNDFANKVSEKPISIHWQRWFDVWEEQNRSSVQLSSRGLPIRWLIAIPVGFRSCHDPSDYSLVACVFLAFDTALDKAKVNNAFRYIMLNLHEANATAWVHRKGELAGRNAAISPAYHELYKVIGAIVPNLTVNSASLIRDYFESLLIEPEKNNYLKEEVSMYSILIEQLKRAAKIEQVVSLAKGGKLSSLSDNEIDKKIDQFANSISELIKIEDKEQMELFFFNTHTKLFGLAAISAFRNMIQHTFINNKRRNPTARCYLIDCSQWTYLVIENTYEETDDYGDPVIKLTGTIAAIRGYVRSYRINPRLVKLERRGCEKLEGSRYYKETWQTLIPLPEVTENTGVTV